jgi:hypothetical protein
VVLMGNPVCGRCLSHARQVGVDSAPPRTLRKERLDVVRNVAVVEGQPWSRSRGRPFPISS